MRVKKWKQFKKKHTRNKTQPLYEAQELAHGSFYQSGKVGMSEAGHSA
jgi:hypothetical protein